MSDSASPYDESYYASHLGGIPYRRGEPEWKAFFTLVADTIAERIAPRTALDVGCAIGFLVEELRDRGIDAYGIDVSEYAIGQVPEPLRPYCRVGSVLGEIERNYDLITCIEVLEHLPPDDAEPAVDNLTRHASRILFSSTPDDFAEPTHLNVQPPWYWARLFAARGFFRDPEVDVRAVATHAVLFRNASDASVLDVVEGYERILERARIEQPVAPAPSWRARLKQIFT